MNKEDEEPKPIRTPGLSFKDIIFEQIDEGQFLYYDRVKGETFTRTLVTHDGIGYIPLEKVPWPTACVPKRSETEDALTKEQLKGELRLGRFRGEYGSEEQLFNEIRDFFKEHLDVRNELLYDVYACFVLMSWRVEDFKVVPYQMFLGPLASGKTRGLECFKFLGYRSIMASSMSAATIFRTLESWHCTLLLDETEIYGRESMVEVLALLNSGYRRGSFVLRIEKLEGEVPQIAMFEVFGPKVLAGTEELAATLQSRAIMSNMTKNVKHVRLFVDEEKAQELRNKLLLYRCRNLGMKSEFDVSTLNGYFTNSRVIELFVSLLEVAPTQEIRDRLIECMRGITQTRLDEEQVSIEAKVFEAILNSAHKVDSGKLSIRTVMEQFNLGLPEKEQATVYWIGRRVSALGFEKCRLTGGLTGFYWDADLVERLKARYATPSTNASLPSFPSLPSLLTEKQKPESEDSENKVSNSQNSGDHETNIISEESEDSEESEGVSEGGF